MGFMDALRGEAIAPTGGAKSGTIGGRTVDAITGLQSTNAEGLFATMKRNRINEEGLKADADLINALKIAESERNLHLQNIFSTAKKKGSAEQKRVGTAAGATAAIRMESTVSAMIRRKGDYHRQIFNIGKAQDAVAAVVAGASAIAEGIGEHWPKPDPNPNKPIYTDDPSVVKFMRDLQKEETGVGVTGTRFSDMRVGGDFAAGGRPAPAGMIPGSGPDDVSWRKTGLPAGSATREEASLNRPYIGAPGRTGGAEFGKKVKDPHFFELMSDLKSKGFENIEDFEALFLSEDEHLTMDPYPSIDIYNQGGFYDPSR